MIDRVHKATLCVAGMHRSGTSLTASWLERCGLKMDDGQTYGPAPGNERGHFEDKDFVDLQSAQILRRFPESQGWIHTGAGDIVTDDLFEREARRLIEVRNQKYPVWGWKDPRSVLLLDAWKRMIPELKVVLLWRPCDPVVSSLVARAKVSTQSVMEVGVLDAVRTWCRYGERMLRYKRAHAQETLLLELHGLLQNDQRAFERISGEFGLALHYKALANSFDASLLHRRRPNIASRVAGFVCGARKLEASLETASDPL